MPKTRNHQIAVVDTSVLILLGVPPREGDAAGTERFEQALGLLRNLQADGVELVVPAPAYAELAGGDAESIIQELGDVLVEPFDLPAAIAAGLLVRQEIKRKPPGTSRHCVKADLMIAAVAHTRNARYLLMANRKDFQRQLDAMGSKTELLDVDRPKGQGRLRLVEKP